MEGGQHTQHHPETFKTLQSVLVTCPFSGELGLCQGYVIRHVIPTNLSHSQGGAL